MQSIYQTRIKENQLYSQTEELYNKILQIFDDSNDDNPSELDIPTLAAYINQFEKFLKKLMTTSYMGDPTISSWYEDLEMFKVQKNRQEWKAGLKSAKKWILNCYNVYAQSKGYSTYLSGEEVNNFINFVLRYDNIDTYKNIIKRIITRQMTSAALYKTINSIIFQTNERVEESINFDFDKKLSLNEGFFNILDSSVVDYSSEFEKEDIWIKSTKPIKDWLNKYGIENYTINWNYSVDVDNYVNLSNKKLKKIEVQFNRVNGDFYCDNNQLTSLEGCPKEVNGSFNCSHNKLISLDGCPEKINGDFDCSENKISSLIIDNNKKIIGPFKNFNCRINQLTSLEGSPKEVGGSFICSYNKLTSLEYCPEKVGNNFICFNNQLTSLEGCPEFIGGDFSCSYNQLTSLKYCPKIINGEFRCEKNKLTSLEYGPNIVNGTFCCENNKLSSLEYSPKEVNYHFLCGKNKLISLEGCPKKVPGSFWCDNNRLISLEGCPKEVGGDFHCENNKLTLDWTEEKLKSICTIHSEFIYGLHEKINEGFFNPFDEEDDIDRIESILKDKKPIYTEPLHDHIVKDVKLWDSNRKNKIYIKDNKIYSSRIFVEGDIVEECPVKLISTSSLYSPEIREMAFEIIPEKRLYGIPAGYANYYRNSEDTGLPGNIDYEYDPKEGIIRIVALKKIKPNDELIFYIKDENNFVNGYKKYQFKY